MNREEGAKFKEFMEAKYLSNLMGLTESDLKELIMSEEIKQNFEIEKLVEEMRNAEEYNRILQIRKQNTNYIFAEVNLKLSQLKLTNFDLGLPKI
jgi:hypothetical protein